MKMTCKRMASSSLHLVEFLSLEMFYLVVCVRPANLFPHLEAGNNYYNLGKEPGELTRRKSDT